MKTNQPSILLTFDVEEFDLPIEYGISISKDEQMEVGRKGLEILKSKVLSQQDVYCTLFTTANFAQTFPELIRSLSMQHEIASHTYFHSSFKTEDLKLSRQALEKIISKEVNGLRMPRMKQVAPSDVRTAGYLYDSSINPTWIPGRYNNLKMPRMPFMVNDIIKIPVSVSPFMRIPLFWMAFKNFPYFYFRNLALRTLKHDGHLLLYFHPWEFTELESYHLPWLIKRKSGDELLNKLRLLMNDLRNYGNFITIEKFLESSQFLHTH